MDRYIKLTRTLKQLPTDAELRLEATRNKSFPSSSTFDNRFGSKSNLLAALIKHCEARTGYEDINALCKESLSKKSPRSESRGQEDGQMGFVYLIKSGRFYKIGKTNAFGRREYELAIQLPEKAATVHVIKTDDPAGIETHWHKRFDAKRKNGEWFDLDASDIKAFKRRKFM